MKNILQQKSVNICRYFSSLLLIFLFSMCGRDGKEWNSIRTQEVDSVYISFIEKYSSGEYADSAFQKLEEIYFSDSDVENQIQNFTQLLNKFQHTSFASATESILENLNLKRDLFPVKLNDSMGYMNSRGDIVINPTFQFAADFRNGLAFVKYNDKWGVINKIGENIIRPEYEEICGFSEGLAAIKVDTAWGYADTTGNFIIAPKFQDAWPFSEGLALVKYNDKWRYITKSGDFNSEIEYDGAYCDEGTGGSLIYEKGIFVAYIRYDRNNIPIIKNHPEWLTQNCGMLFFYHENWCYQKGVVNFSSIPDLWVDNYSEGLARRIKNGSWGYIDTNEQQVIKSKFNYCSNFLNGIALVQLNNKLGFINNQGEVIINPQYDAANAEFSEGLNNVKKFNRYGYIDRSGTLIVSHQFEEAYPFHEGLAAVKRKNKWGFINRSGEYIIESKYDKVRSFSEGFAVIKLNDKWGFVNLTGEMVIDNQYDRVHSFDKGIAKVWINEKEAYINKYGNIVRDTL